MWVRLTLKNWRSIGKATVEFGPFSVLVGRNSSGKSNFVDALKFAEEVARDATTAVAQRGGITSIRRWRPSKPNDITVEVRTAPTEDGLDDDFSSHKLVLTSGQKGEWRFKSEDITVHWHRGEHVEIHRDGDALRVPVGAQLTLFGSEERAIAPTTSAMLVARQMVRLARRPVRPMEPLPRVKKIRPVPEEMRKPQPPSESDQLMDDGQNIATALERMGEVGRARVLDAMRQIVPGLKRVGAEPAGRYLALSFEQSHEQGKVAEFAATEMSEGALRALAVVVAAQQVRKSDLLIVEEPEVNLHPGAAGVVYDVLKRASEVGTVLVTTHSPELLDHASDDSILVCDYRDGVTTIGPLSNKQRELVRDGLFKVAELMRADELRREGASHRVVTD